jgi:hypothetical protein
LGRDLLRGGYVSMPPSDTVSEVCSVRPSLEELFDATLRDVVANTKIPMEKRSAFEGFLKRWKDVFAKNPDNPGICHMPPFEFHLVDDVPVKQRPYRAPFSHRRIIEQKVQDMLDAGIIRHSTSPWASPVILVDKKDGTKRFCVDYRKLNAKTVTDNFPLPLVDDILSHFRSGRPKYFSKADCAAGYHQRAIKESDKQKTAFVTHNGLYEFNVTPFGPKNCPAGFQREMNAILQPVLTIYCFVYMDDIIIFSDHSYEDHIVALEAVFALLLKNGVKLKLKKCEFFQEEISFLGHRLTQNGLAPDLDKVKALVDMPYPQDLPSLRRFLGMAGYYRRFIKNFSSIVAPLNRLTRKNHAQ